MYFAFYVIWNKFKYNTIIIQLQYLGTLSEYNTITLKYGHKFNIIVLGQPYTRRVRRVPELGLLHSPILNSIGWSALCSGVWTYVPYVYIGRARHEIWAPNEAGGGCRIYLPRLGDSGCENDYLLRWYGCLRETTLDGNFIAPPMQSSFHASSPDKLTLFCISSTVFYRLGTLKH